MKKSVLFCLLFPLFSLTSAQNGLSLSAHFLYGKNDEKSNFHQMQSPTTAPTPIKSINTRRGIDFVVAYRFKKRLELSLGARYYEVGQTISLTNLDQSKRDRNFNYNLTEFPLTFSYHFVNIFAQRKLYPYLSLGLVVSNYPNLRIMNSGKMYDLDMSYDVSISYWSYKNTSELFTKQLIALGIEKQIWKGFLGVELYYMANLAKEKFLVGKLDYTYYPNYPSYAGEERTISSFYNYDNFAGIKIGYRVPILGENALFKRH